MASNCAIEISISTFQYNIDFSCECLSLVMITPNYAVNVQLRVAAAKTSKML